MKKNYKILVTMCLACVLAFSCTISSADEIVVDENKTYEWSYFSDYAIGKDSPDDAYVKQKIEEAFNVKIKFETYTGDDYAQALNLKVASGDIPDVFLSSTYLITEKYARQGVSAKIPTDLIYKNAPNMTAYVDAKDPTSWVFTTVDGENYGIPVVWPLGDHSRVNVIREDWLDKLGLDIPTNIDEFENVLLAIRDNDPDGNGINDTYGMGGYMTATTENIYPGIFGMFGAHPNIFYLNDDGELIYGAIDPNCVKALEYLNKWYNEGFIDPEFYVDTSDSWTQKWVSGKQGYIASSYWWTSGPAGKYFSGKWYDPVIEANPEAKVTNFKPMTGPEGKSGLAQLSMQQVIPVIAFGKHMEQNLDVVSRFLQVQDVLQSDAYWHTLIYDGEEGVTFTRNEDNSITYTDIFDTFDERSWYGANGAFSPAPNYDVYDPAVKDMDYVNAQRALAIGPVDALNNYPLKANTEYKTNLQAIVSKAMVDFITGKRPLSDWDAYVQEWLDNGGQATLDEARDVYANILSK